MHILIAYIKFLFRSTNQHGVHSPFVYGLVTKCFYNRKKYPSYEILKEFRRSLLKDKNLISVTDFGAGSRVFKSEKRKVSEIAKNAGISPNRARLLNRLTRYLQVEKALELGTSVGLGTAAIAAGNKVQVISIEGCPETAKVAAEKVRKFGLDNIELKVGKFEEVLEQSGQWAVDSGKNSKFQIPNSKFSPTGVSAADPSSEENINLTTHNRQPTTENSQTTNNKRQTTEYDLVYIDGNHQKEATLRYFEQLLLLVHNDSIMIFDDIHWSPEMEEAWEEIKEHSAVKVSIDTFQWGLVFFRREQEKEHFVIRV